MAFSEETNTGTSNNTTDVTVVGSPASGERHISRNISIYNADTASATVEVMHDDGTNQRTILKTTLATGDTLFIDDILVVDDTSSSIVMKLSGAVTTTQLPFTAHYGVAS